MAKTYRLRTDTEEALSSKRIKFILETKDEVKESDVLHTVLWKYLDKITIKDVEEYRQEVLNKD